MRECRRIIVGLALCLALAPAAAAQAPTEDPVADGNGELVQLDFQDVELSVVIDTIARLSGRNFIYDDRVRGRVTIVSPTKVTVDQAYAVFESVLQVKGFTTVEAPGNAVKIIPIREAKESSIETVQGRRRPPESDRFVTRLIPLRFIDAEAITNTLKPLVSKDAAMVAYAPTNTVILTDAATNIRRILAIIDSIDVETHKEELSVIKVNHADAGTLAQHISQIYGAETSTAGTPGRQTAAARRRTARAAATNDAAKQAAKGKIRIITDERTNSLIVLASRSRTEDIRQVLRRLDVPVTGYGRIHVHYLKHADAEELAETLNGLISGQSASPTAAQPGRAVAPQALRSAVTELAEGVTITADAPTNSLVIQASQEGYNTVRAVIEALDIQRPQVLVEALIMEVDVTDGETLGFNGVARVFHDNTNFGIGSLSDTAARPTRFLALPTADGGTERRDGDRVFQDGGFTDVLTNLVGTVARNSLKLDPATGLLTGTLIQGVIRASADLNGTNVLSAPHILTSDNEEAEIKVGANIPIITSRVQSAAGIDQAVGDLATSVNVERQDIGVTLRVTPQISEGDHVRLEIFQEITDINPVLAVGDPNEVGVSLTNRKVENVVVVGDSETVVIGGLISDDYVDTESKVPWLGDIPLLGWLFKTTTKNLMKQNLLVFLTPHIIRSKEDLERTTIRKREEFTERSNEALALTEREKKEAETRREKALAAGVPVEQYIGDNPVRGALKAHDKRYPLERMREIEEMEEEEAERVRTRSNAAPGPRYAVLAAVYGDEGSASGALTELIDAGYDGTLRSSDSEGNVVYEIHLGPYRSLKEADRKAAEVRQAFGLSPQVVVVRQP